MCNNFRYIHCCYQCFDFFFQFKQQKASVFTCFILFQLPLLIDAILPKLSTEIKFDLKKTNIIITIKMINKFVFKIIEMQNGISRWQSNQLNDKMINTGALFYNRMYDVFYLLFASLLQIPDWTHKHVVQWNWNLFCSIRLNWIELNEVRFSLHYLLSCLIFFALFVTIPLCDSTKTHSMV